MGNHASFVFFSGGHPFEWRASLIRTLTGSPLAHVMVGNIDGVLDPHPEGDRIIPFADAVMTYPALRLFLEIPCPVEYTPAATTRPFPHWLRILASWATGGLITSNDCVSRVKAALHSVGVTVPTHVRTPQALYDALRPIAANETRIGEAEEMPAQPPAVDGTDRVSQTEVPAPGL